MLARLENDTLRTDCSVEQLLCLARSGAARGVAVISREDADLWLDGAREMLMRADADTDRLALLIRPRRPPVLYPRHEQPVESFVCIGAIASHVAAVLAAPSQLLSAFEVAQAVLDAPRPVRIRCLQGPAEIGETEPAALSTSAPRVQWVMPHAGSLAYLRSSVRSLAMTNARLNGEITIGIDDDERPEHLRVCEGVDRCRVFFADPTASGPYRIRNALVAQSDAEIVLFQDSDDVSCEDRGRRLIEALDGSPWGMVGSHVVHVDTFERQLIPLRYPLNVTAALERAPVYSLLHPASAVRRAALQAAGGFSTLARHSMDAQFLLRSHFHFPSGNVDGFLYIRRIRAGSLTTHRSTKLGTIVRRKLELVWERDFRRVAQGELSVDASMLRAQAGDATGFRLRLPPTRIAVTS